MQNLEFDPDRLRRFVADHHASGSVLRDITARLKVARESVNDREAILAQHNRSPVKDKRAKLGPKPRRRSPTSP